MVKGRGRGSNPLPPTIFIKLKNMRQIVKTFLGVTDMSDYLQRATTSASFEGHKLYSNIIKSGWSSMTYNESDNLLRFGDVRNAERISSRVQEITRMRGSGTQMRRQSFNDVVGYAVHVPNYLTGVPTTMINSRRVSIRSSKVLNIVYNSTFHDGTNLDDVVDAGAKVLTYLRDLEVKGYRVNLYVMMSSKGGSEQCTVLVKVKDSEQYLNITKTAYPIVNPDFLRRHFCRLLECETKDREFPLSYGRPVYMKYDIQNVFDACRLKVDKYLTFYDVQRNEIER